MESRSDASISEGSKAVRKEGLDAPMDETDEESYHSEEGSFEKSVKDHPLIKEILSSSSTTIAEDGREKVKMRRLDKLKKHVASTYFITYFRRIVPRTFTFAPHCNAP